MTLSDPELRTIAVDALVFSSTASQAERRAHLDKEQLAELARSIKSHGILQPIVVRFAPLTHKQGGAVVAGVFYERPGDIDQAHRTHFEVVAGERRAIAAKQAGLAMIPATVRELTDEQVLELQLIENLQRQDLHELAEAEGYEALLKLGHTAEDMAAKVGKSKATIYARMKLLALCPQARKDFYAGKISASIALLLARVSNAKLQQEALTQVINDRQWGDGPMSYREAQEFIQQHYMLKLSSAPFKPSDAELVPSAGACGSCPKRTGNQPELFGDVKSADVCTDPGCFKQKVLAHSERLLANAKAGGQTIIQGPAAKKIAPRGAEFSLTGYHCLDDRDYDGSGTYRQTMGKTFVPTLLQDPDSGRVIEIASDSQVAKVRGSRPSREDSYKSQQRATERKHRLAIAYRVALFKAVREASPKRKQLTREELEGVAEQIYDRLDHDSKKRLLSACGHEIKKRKGSYGQDTDWPVQFKQMTDDELVQVARDAVLAHELQVWNYGGAQVPKGLEAAAKRVGVNAAKIKREIEEAAAAKAKKKAPAKPRGKK
jgi:ParB/RepB/Spo0J family partition protein